MDWGTKLSVKTSNLLNFYFHQTQHQEKCTNETRIQAITFINFLIYRTISWPKNVFLSFQIRLSIYRHNFNFFEEV